MRRAAGWVAVLAVAVFAAVGLWSAATGPAPTSVEDRSREIAQSLRCPTCMGESIADSAGLLSDAMRQIVEQQVREGRSADEVRAWFAERYGQEVLLDPPLHGYGWLLWAAPLALVGAGVVVLVRYRRPSRRWLGPAMAALAVAVVAGVWVAVAQESPAGGDGEPEPLAGSVDVEPGAGGLDAAGEPGAGGLDGVAVLQDAVARAPGDVGLRQALAGALESAGHIDQAVEEYDAVVRLSPLDPDARYRLAFALVRSGEAEPAVDLLEETLTFRGDHPPSLLLLGTLLREEDPQRGESLLQQFVALEPEHPAAQDLAELLDGTGSSSELVP